MKFKSIVAAILLTTSFAFAETQTQEKEFLTEEISKGHPLSMKFRVNKYDDLKLQIEGLHKNGNIICFLTTQSGMVMVGDDNKCRINFGAHQDEVVEVSVLSSSQAQKAKVNLYWARH